LTTAEEAENKTDDGEYSCDEAFDFWTHRNDPSKFARVSKLTKVDSGSSSFG
jgi:hypothetical protein